MKIKFSLHLEGQKSGRILLSLELNWNSIQCFYDLQIALLLKYNTSDIAKRSQVQSWLEANWLFSLHLGYNEQKKYVCHCQQCA